MNFWWYAGGLAFGDMAANGKGGDQGWQTAPRMVVMEITGAKDAKAALSK